MYPASTENIRRHKYSFFCSIIRQQDQDAKVHPLNVASGQIEMFLLREVNLYALHPIRHVPCQKRSYLLLSSETEQNWLLPSNLKMIDTFRNVKECLLDKKCDMHLICLIGIVNAIIIRSYSENIFKK